MTETIFTQKKAALQAKWQLLEPRDKKLLLVALGVVLAAFVWWVLLAPPLNVLRQAAAQQRGLDAQLQAVQSLKAQAQNLKSTPTMKRDAALAALQSSVKSYGTTAQLEASGDRVTLTLRAMPADALAQWLALARTGARTLPLEARLQRTPGPTAAWDGTLVLGLPPQ